MKSRKSSKLLEEDASPGFLDGTNEENSGLNIEGRRFSRFNDENGEACVSGKLEIIGAKLRGPAPARPARALITSNTSGESTRPTRALNTSGEPTRPARVLITSNTSGESTRPTRALVTSNTSGESTRPTRALITSNTSGDPTRPTRVLITSSTSGELSLQRLRSSPEHSGFEDALKVKQMIKPKREKVKKLLRDSNSEKFESTFNERKDRKIGKAQRKAAENDITELPPIIHVTKPVFLKPRTPAKKTPKIPAISKVDQEIFQKLGITVKSTLPSIVPKNTV